MYRYGGRISLGDLILHYFSRPSVKPSAFINKKSLNFAVHNGFREVEEDVCSKKVVIFSWFRSTVPGGMTLFTQHPTSPQSSSRSSHPSVSDLKLHVNVQQFEEPSVYQKYLSQAQRPLSEMSTSYTGSLCLCNLQPLLAPPARGVPGSALFSLHLLEHGGSSFLFFRDPEKSCTVWYRKIWYREIKHPRSVPILSLKMDATSR